MNHKTYKSKIILYKENTNKQTHIKPELWNIYKIYVDKIKNFLLINRQVNKIQAIKMN